MEAVKLQVNVTKQLKVTGTSWSRHTSCLSSWLSTLRRSRTPTSSPSFRLLCRSSFMYSQALDKIPPLLWNRSYNKASASTQTAGSHRVPQRSPVPSWCSRRYSLEWPLTAARSSCWSCPGASAQLSVKRFAYLHCHNSQIKFPLHVCAHLRCAGLAVSHLWRPAERPASYKTRYNKNTELLQLTGKLNMKCSNSGDVRWNYAMYGWVRGAIVLWLDPVKTSCGDIIT